MHALFGARLSFIARIALATAVGISSLALNATFASAATGAIFTTAQSCGGVNINIFDSKDAVYLDGGPHHAGSAGLEPGDYYVQVTVPDGDVLGSSHGVATAHVGPDGSMSCDQLNSLVFSASSNFTTLGYDDTSNNGGEYKVWVSKDADFSGGTNKTDNFKVKTSEGGPNPQDLGSISGLKWEDANADGIFDPDEQELPNWTIQLYDAAHANLIATTNTDSLGFYSFDNVAVGTYQVCEVLQDNWHPSFPTINTPNCQTDVAITTSQKVLNSNFGNYRYANLTVVKHVLNDNGGTKVASDFTMNVTGANVSNPSFVGSEAGVTVNLKPGAYTADEAALFGYVESTSTECVGTATSGQIITCTITNDDIQPKITLTKTVINDNGGTLQIFDFPLFVGATGVTSGIQVGVNAGSYSASETNHFGYAPSAWGGDCAADGSIILLPGDVKACTITNDDIQPKLIVVKNVVNNNTGTKVASDFVMTVATSTLMSFPGAATPGTTVFLNAGTYSVTEGAHVGYNMSTSADCVASINIGEVKTCTVTNDDIPPTRTQGFWSTHTTATNLGWNNNVIDSVKNLCTVGARFVTATSTPNSKNDVMGGFWSNVAKKSSGQNRATVDKSRMALLQQLLAGTLNYYVLGSRVDGGVVAAGKTAYCGSADANVINAATVALDAYNQSGDPVVLPAGFNQGSATPTISQTQANIKFWDTTI